jgi:hypothetical protein
MKQLTSQSSFPLKAMTADVVPDSMNAGDIHDSVQPPTE